MTGDDRLGKEGDRDEILSICSQIEELAEQKAYERATHSGQSAAKTKIGPLIRKLRQRLGMADRGELAARVGVDPYTVYRWETDKATIRLATARQLRDLVTGGEKTSRGEVAILGYTWSYVAGREQNADRVWVFSAERLLEGREDMFSADVFENLQENERLRYFYVFPAASEAQQYFERWFARLPEGMKQDDEGLRVVGLAIGRGDVAERLPLFALGLKYIILEYTEPLPAHTAATGAPAVPRHPVRHEGFLEAYCLARSEDTPVPSAQRVWVALPEDHVGDILAKYCHPLSDSHRVEWLAKPDWDIRRVNSPEKGDDV